MYKTNPFYTEALKKLNKKYQCRILFNSGTIGNESIASLKFDQALIEEDKFSVGGVHAATIHLELLNFEGNLDTFNFDNKEFTVELRLKLKELYTVAQVQKIKINLLNSLHIKNLTSLWIPIGKFYATEVKKNSNKTISIKLIDKSKYMDDEYISELSYPATLKQVRDEVYNHLQIVNDTNSFLNENEPVTEKLKGFTYKQILGYIAECACSYELINRKGHGELIQFSDSINKTVEKGVFKEFIPAESYVTIKKVKYFNGIIGEESGHVLELNNENPFISDNIAQNILNNIRNFTYISYSLKQTNSDIATDCGDKISITNTKNIEFKSFVMCNNWEFNGQISQDLSAKGESELNNSYTAKGPIRQTIERIQKQEIPNTLNSAIKEATKLLTEFNGGYVIKKDGELFISDNEDLDKAEHVWRWNINGLGYSSTGIQGPFGLAMTMDGAIVASFITSGFMSADRLQGGTLKIGGINNINGEILVVDADNQELVRIGIEGVTLSNGTKLIGGNGVLSNFQFKGRSSGLSDSEFLGFEPDYVNNNNTVIKSKIIFDALIPDNFEITEAKIYLRHAPVHFTSSLGTTSFWGYARKIQAFKVNNLNFKRTAYIMSSYVDNVDYDTTDTKGFGDNGFTPIAPTNSSYNAQAAISSDIKQHLTSGYNMIILESNEDTPEMAGDRVEKALYSKTGQVQATLNVIGYMK